MLHKASGRRGEHQMPLATVNTLDKQKQNQTERAAPHGARRHLLHITKSEKRPFLPPPLDYSSNSLTGLSAHSGLLQSMHHSEVRSTVLNDSECMPFSCSKAFIYTKRKIGKTPKSITQPLHTFLPLTGHHSHIYSLHFRLRNHPCHGFAYVIPSA